MKINVIFISSTLQYLLFNFSSLSSFFLLLIRLFMLFLFASLHNFERACHVSFSFVLLPAPAGGISCTLLPYLHHCAVQQMWIHKLPSSCSQQIIFIRPSTLYTLGTARVRHASIFIHEGSCICNTKNRAEAAQQSTTQHLKPTERIVWDIK